MSDELPERGGRTFQSAYEGAPPWEIGRAQRAFVELAGDGTIEGPVLDVGCGTGENALLFAERGYDVLGVDAVDAAIDRARAKARERNLDAEFRVHDAYDLATLERTFETIVDSGLFHVLAGDDPERYAASLRRVVRPEGGLFVLGYDRDDTGQGPGVSRTDFHDAFADGWRVDSIDESVYETDGEEYKRRAWLATIRPSE